MSTIRTKANPKIVTTSNQGAENGFLVPILNVHDKFVAPEQWPQQIYCTVAKPGEIKGPHLHKKRWGLFTCIAGNIKIVARLENGRYEEYFSGDDHDYQTVQIPAEIPSAIVNVGSVDAYVLNMPAPSWHQDDQDDWDVEFDDYSFD